MPTPSAWVFDCDGTLVDSETAHADALWQTLAEVGVQVDREILHDRFIGVDNPTILAWISSNRQIRLPSDFDARLQRHTERAIGENVHAIAGAEVVVRSLAAAGVPLAVASNSSAQTVEAMLHAVSLLSYFKGHIASRDKVQFPKPAADIYRLAAQLLGVPPQTCVAVEDSVLGIRSARAAGTTVIGFCPGETVGDRRALVDAGAERVVGRLTDLLSLDWTTVPLLRRTEPP
jgi:HAD superfamily hydrolase (TIGR01509 family)